jgi:tetratricopeptide (TPR) repeat protein
MISDSIQPLSSLGPLDKGPEPDVNEINDPARLDYIKARERYTASDFSEAAALFHNALKGFEEQGDEAGIANASDRLGDTCMAKEEYTLALEHYKRAFDICEKLEDSFSTLALNKKMAAAYRKLGKLEETLVLLDDMLEHYHLTKNPQGTVEILIVTAEVFIQQGKIKAAADAYHTVSAIHAGFKHKKLANEFLKRAEDLTRE